MIAEIDCFLSLYRKNENSKGYVKYAEFTRNMRDPPDQVVFTYWRENVESTKYILRTEAALKTAIRKVCILPGPHGGCCIENTVWYHGISPPKNMCSSEQSKYIVTDIYGNADEVVHEFAETVQNLVGRA